MDHKAQNARLLKVLLWGGGLVAMVVFVIPAILLFFASRDPQFQADMAAQEAARASPSDAPAAQTAPPAPTAQKPPAALPGSIASFKAAVEAAHPEIRGLPWSLSFQSAVAGECWRAELDDQFGPFYEYCTHPDGRLYRVWFEGITSSTPPAAAGRRARPLVAAAAPGLAAEQLRQVDRLAVRAASTVADSPSFIPVGDHWLRIDRMSPHAYRLNISLTNVPGPGDKVLR